MFENIKEMTDEEILIRCKEIYETYSREELKIVMGKDFHMFMEIIGSLD